MAAADDVANPFTYTGRQFDAESGIYQYRYRYYQAQLGRFVGRDPAGYEDGTINLYEYVHSHPVSMRDPLGLGCFVEFECKKTDEQVVDNTKRLCFYNCSIVKATLNAKAPDVEMVDQRICDLFKRWKNEGVTWPEERTHLGSGFMVFRPLKIFGCIPPAKCDDPLKYSAVYVSNDEDAPDCNKADCRKSCDGGGPALLPFCTLLKGPASKLLCELAANLTKAACYDMCNVICHDRELPNP